MSNMHRPLPQVGLLVRRIVGMWIWILIVLLVSALLLAVVLLFGPPPTRR